MKWICYHDVESEKFVISVVILADLKKIFRLNSKTLFTVRAWERFQFIIESQHKQVFLISLLPSCWHGNSCREGLIIQCLVLSSSRTSCRENCRTHWSFPLQSKLKTISLQRLVLLPPDRVILFEDLMSLQPATPSPYRFRSWWDWEESAKFGRCLLPRLHTWRQLHIFILFRVKKIDYHPCPLQLGNCIFINFRTSK